MSTAPGAGADDRAAVPDDAAPAGPTDTSTGATRAPPVVEPRETASQAASDNGPEAAHAPSRSTERGSDTAPGDPSESVSRGRAGRRGGWWPSLVAGVVGLLALLGVVGATVLIDARLRVTREATDAVMAAWAQSHDRIAASRQLETARALARQVRHAPPGSAGGDARRVPMVKASALLRDPALHLLLSPDALDELDRAVMALETLANARAGRGEVEGSAIAWRLAALSRFAAPADAPPDTSRASLIRGLHDVLARAARADVTALSLLERDARRLAARAIAADGVSATTAEGSGGLVFAAVEAALSIPALRAAEIAAVDRAETLWRRVDGSLAGLADRLLAEGDDGLLSSVERQRANVDRLTQGLLAVLLAALALGLAGFVLTWTSIVVPAGRLGRWAVRLGGRSAGGQVAVADVLATVEDLQARTARAEEETGAARADALVLRAALLGAAPEAALGRSLATVAQELQTMLGDIRAHATLARHECETLVPPDHPTRGRGPRPLPPHQDRAAHVILDACAALRDQCEFAAHLVGALRGLAGAEHSRRHAIDLTRTLEETLSVLAPRLRALGASVRLSCNEPVVVRGDPVALGAVLFYVVEGAVLRAEGAMVRSRSPERDGGAGPMIAAADSDQGRFTFDGAMAGVGSARPPGVVARLNGVSVAAVLESGGRVRLTIADDGPAPGAALRALERILDPSRPDGLDRTLVPALRDAPEVAALVLADALARAGLGRGLDVLAGEDWGLTVRLYLPLQATDDDG